MDGFEGNWGVKRRIVHGFEQKKVDRCLKLYQQMECVE
jgi:hypothetical protein